ncbi:hypothetical protein E2C01_036622 [Portunus trituberculatus]|uniref:Uncharacterized protein n=1 Tax=Portunus trituberculatus TaxID=210409 RepID=A0A5B7FBP5_PORTR|nr:hypothetical protein [Portunus trituberculatus]
MSILHLPTESVLRGYLIIQSYGNLASFGLSYCQVRLLSTLLLCTYPAVLVMGNVYIPRG